MNFLYVLANHGWEPGLLQGGVSFLCDKVVVSSEKTNKGKTSIVNLV